MKKKYNIPDSSNPGLDVLIDAIVNGASVQEIEKLHLIRE